MEPDIERLQLDAPCHHSSDPPGAVDNAVERLRRIRERPESLQQALITVLSQGSGGCILCADSPVVVDARGVEMVQDASLTRRLARLGFFTKRYDGGELGSLLLAWKRQPECRPLGPGRLAHNLPHPHCSGVEHFAPGSALTRFEQLRSVRHTGTGPACPLCGFSLPLGDLYWWCKSCHLSCCTNCAGALPLTVFHSITAATATATSQAPSLLGEWPRLDEAGRPFAWFLWTGDNPMPAYLQSCIDTFRVRAARHFCVRVVHPADLATLLGDQCSADGSCDRGNDDGHSSPGPLHPAYEYLSLVHRSDYLRCELLHQYGGLYCDVDTICCGDLSGPLAELAGSDGSTPNSHDGRRHVPPCCAVLPGASMLHETGMNAGLFRRASTLTDCWREAMLSRLDSRLSALKEFRAQNDDPKEDALEWNELLRDLIVPLCATLEANPQTAEAAVVRHTLRAVHWNPDATQGFNPLQHGEATLAEIKGLDDANLIVLNNNSYSADIKYLSRDEFLESGCAIAELVRKAAR
jgi:hypothetical protein